MDLYDLKTKWNGSITTKEFEVEPQDIAAKRLDIAIPDSPLNAEQKKSLEDIAKLAAEDNILFRITVIK